MFHRNENRYRLAFRHFYQTSKVKCNLRDSNLRDAAHIEST